MRKFVLMAATILGGMASAGAAGAFSLTSPDIKPGATIADEQVANVFGCTGKNLSPELS